jgi:tRNA(adenine34) deaminase
MLGHSIAFSGTWRSTFRRCLLPRAGVDFANSRKPPRLGAQHSRSGKSRSNVARFLQPIRQESNVLLATQERSAGLPMATFTENGYGTATPFAVTEECLDSVTGASFNRRTMATHEHYMRMALALAEEAYQRNEVPVGAILVVRRGSESTSPDVILARGRNRIEECCDATAHAEIECLRAASARLQTWRLNRAGTREQPLACQVTLYCTLEPCAMCLSAMQLARVTRLVYGAPGLRLGAVESYVPLLSLAPPHPFHRFSEVVPGVLANESAFLLRRFFQERRYRTEPAKPTTSNETRSLWCHQSKVASREHMNARDP